MSEFVSEIWSYDAFTPGEVLGRIAIPLDEVRIALWSKVFPNPVPTSRLSQSVLISAMMEGYLKIAQPRPPGNIHAAQKVRFFGINAVVGQTLHITTSCREKSVRSNRKWISFDSRIVSGDNVMLEGEILAIWAR